MKKILLFTLALVSLIILIIGITSQQAVTLLGFKDKSGIRVLTVPEGAIVFLDGKEVGKTPIENEELEDREYFVKLVKDDTSWEGRVKLIGKTLTVVNRELSKDPASSAGEVLNLKKGKGVTVISNPSEADVEVDGKFYGKTPISIEANPGEHTFGISRSNYLKRSVRAYLPEDYNLILTVDLALSEADLSTINTPVTTSQVVLVKDTPTGFLRVREKPSTSGKEIGRVKPGEELALLEETPGWNRVRLSDGTEGYVSSTYVEKKNP